MYESMNFLNFIYPFIFIINLFTCISLFLVKHAIYLFNPFTVEHYMRMKISWEIYDFENICATYL